MNMMKMNFLLGYHCQLQFRNGILFNNTDTVIADARTNEQQTIDRV